MLVHHWLPPSPPPPSSLMSLTGTHLYSWSKWREALWELRWRHVGFPFTHHKCLAQEHIAVTLVRLKPILPESRQSLFFCSFMPHFRSLVLRARFPLSLALRARYRKERGTTARSLDILLNKIKYYSGLDRWFPPPFLTHVKMKTC